MKNVDLFKSTRAQIIVSGMLIALIVVARLAPHAANFTPVAAVGLFAGVYLRKSWALLIPLAGLVISDFFLDGYSWKGRAIVYGAFLLMIAIGRIISQKGKLFSESGKFGQKFLRVIAGSLLGAVLFFIITNNIFLYTPSFYQMNFSGMIESYVAGLPFFRSQLLGDLMYSGLLFGIYEFARIFANKSSEIAGKVKI